MDERIAVIGLGYVGLPVALAFARKFPNTVGFDIDQRRVAELNRHIDRTHEASQEDLRNSTLHITAKAEDLAGTTCFIVTVPTPIDSNKQPNLSAVISASETIGKVLIPGSVVIYESTVYPGVTEEICGPILAKTSGLRQGVDFKLGYSPERINPGDKEHSLECVTKVVSAEDAATLERVAQLYASIIKAGIHRAPTIKTAEAAKVIENTQRDLNIALMNELSLIFDRLRIRTKDVLEAAATKWNFLRFTPGLVGGHCIGVDPYYLTAKAESVGHHPDVILAGRRINDSMGTYIAQRLIKLLIERDLRVKGARVAVLGLTFKENVSDLRNSRVPNIIDELYQFGIAALAHDPLAYPEEAKEHYGIDLVEWEQLVDLDCIVFAVGHRQYLEIPPQQIFDRIRNRGVFVDVKSLIDPAVVPERIRYWSL